MATPGGLRVSELGRAPAPAESNSQVASPGPDPANFSPQLVPGGTREGAGNEIQGALLRRARATAGHGAMPTSLHAGIAGTGGDNDHHDNGAATGRDHPAAAS